MIRAATASDVIAISTCVNCAYQHYIERMGQKPGPMLADYAQLVETHPVFVFVEQNEPANKRVCAVLVMKNTAKRALMDTVAVSPAWQGQGIGKSLIDFAESAARAQGYKFLHLYTHELMTENIDMYSALGYREEKRITQAGFNRVYMEKSLVVD